MPPKYISHIPTVHQRYAYRNKLFAMPTTDLLNFLIIILQGRHPAIANCIIDHPKLEEDLNLCLRYVYADTLLDGNIHHEFHAKARYVKDNLEDTIFSIIAPATKFVGDLAIICSKKSMKEAYSLGVSIMQIHALIEIGHYTESEWVDFVETVYGK